MRIRSIKPDFWTSLPVAELSPEAKLTFIGLWNCADDEGRGRAEPRAIKAKLWGMDDDASSTRVQDWLHEIEKQGLVILYEDDGRSLFQVRSWSEHQKINKPTPSSLPAPVGFTESSGSATGGNRLEGRKEEGRKEGSPPPVTDPDL